jgi:hypothetical protein
VVVRPIIVAAAAIVRAAPINRLILLNSQLILFVAMGCSSPDTERMLLDRNILDKTFDENFAGCSLIDFYLSYCARSPPFLCQQSEHSSRSAPVESASS